MDMILNEYDLLIFSCWNDKSQSLTIDMTKDKCTGQYPLGIFSLFFTDTYPFSN